MPSSRSQTICSVINSGKNIQLGVPANNNLPVAEIEACLKAHAEKVKSGKPRRQHKKLWDAFSNTHLRAAQKIYYGFQMRFGKSGIRTQTYDNMPRGVGFVENSRPDLDDLFSDWAKAAFGGNISISAALDVIVFGKSFREIDSDHSKRKGYAKDNLNRSLDLYMKIVKTHHNREN